MFEVALEVSHSSRRPVLTLRSPSQSLTARCRPSHLLTLTLDERFDMMGALADRPNHEGCELASWSGCRGLSFALVGRLGGVRGSLGVEMRAGGWVERGDESEGSFRRLE